LKVILSAQANMFVKEGKEVEGVVSRIDVGR
jgi:hypothetical protein